MTDPTNEFKPNIYPIMYWALAFAVVAGIVLYLVSILGQFITILWFPVFIAGLAWGGYRNYHKQKEVWQANSGVPATPQSPIDEFKQAFRDITEASRELMTPETPAGIPGETTETIESVGGDTEEVVESNEPEIIPEEPMEPTPPVPPTIDPTLPR